MRPTSSCAARLRAVAGALLITVPAAAPAVAAAPLPAPPAAPAGVTLAPVSRSLRAGQPLDVQASTSPVLAGRLAALEQQSGGGPWLTLVQAPVEAGGRIRLRVLAQRSGLLRVSVGAPAKRGFGAPSAAPASPSLTSAAAFLAVGARLELGARRLSVRAGQDAWVSGRVRPPTAARRVLLDVAGVAGWHQAAAALSDSAGRYRLAIRTRHSGVSRLRVRFPGDRDNTGALRRLQALKVFRTASVSTFGGSDGLDGSALACGGTLGRSTLGVANRTLPCGTRLTLRYRQHEVRVAVVDRGPYVGAREYDLTSATAARLGFSGTGLVWTTG